ncbi:hypothetical protein P4I17_15505 [Paenibacillus lautus]|nr:hypothetical protein [Paenibacillus lautus]MEC0256624.1 hypothetical protein [Paenibacillus lautus]
MRGDYARFLPVCSRGELTVSGIIQEQARLYPERSVDSDPQLAAEALLKLVECEDPPLRLILGSMVFDVAINTYEERVTLGSSRRRSAVLLKKQFPHLKGTGNPGTKTIVLIK